MATAAVCSCLMFDGGPCLHQQLTTVHDAEINSQSARYDPVG